MLTNNDVHELINDGNQLAPPFVLFRLGLLLVDISPAQVEIAERRYDAHKKPRRRERSNFLARPITRREVHYNVLIQNVANSPHNTDQPNGRHNAKKRCSSYAAAIAFIRKQIERNARNTAATTED